jgi:mono/diheme cytochrome c family protein
MKRVVSIAAMIGLFTGLFEARADVDFEKDVKPIFENNCLRCHNPEKAKGKLRMDTREMFMKGSENGPIIVAGKPEESLLFKLINQPKDSDDRMPPEGDPLKKEEIEKVRLWIAAGAKWPDGMTLKVAGALANTQPKEDPGLPISEAEKAAVAQLQSAGVLAIRLAQNTNWLRVDFSLRGKEVKPEELALLKDIPNLAELNLGNTMIDDAMLVHLKPLVNLTRLGLHNTKITDGGLAHLQDMAKLESLNVYGTAVTDAGLEKLARLKSLKRLYVWQTKVTLDGAKKLTSAVQGVHVERGYDEPPPPANSAPQKPDEKKEGKK